MIVWLHTCLFYSLFLVDKRIKCKSLPKNIIVKYLEKSFHVLHAFSCSAYHLNSLYFLSISFKKIVERPQQKSNATLYFWSRKSQSWNTKLSRNRHLRGISLIFISFFYFSDHYLFSSFLLRLVVFCETKRYHILFTYWNYGVVYARV